MKKWTVLFILAGVVVLSFVIISMARQNAYLPRVEDKASQEASAFVPVKIMGEPSAKGSDELKLTGPVYDLDNKK
jgi:hypothetical protein